MKMILPSLALIAALATPLLAQDKPGGITAAGTVRARSSIELRSEVSGKTTVLWVIPEGTSVKKGDLLLRLDSAALQEQVAQQKINSSIAKAAVVRAEAELATAQVSFEGVKKIHAMQVKAAGREREAVLGKGGKLELDSKQAASEIKIAKARLAAAEAEAVRFKKDDGDGVLPAKVTLALVEAQELLENATRRREHIDRVLRGSLTAAEDLKQLRIEVEMAQQRAALEHKLEAGKAEVVAAIETIQASRARLDRAIRSLSRCQIQAPAAGTVVHVNQPSRTRTGGFVLEAGAEVRERQPLLQLPDLSRLRVETLVSAKELGLLKLGQTAQVALDAFPNRSLEGVVQFISPAAEPRPFLGTKNQRYKVLVDLKPPHDGARIGMTAVVVINTGTKPQPKHK